MADSAQASGQPKSAGRRNFLKIGAGVAAGVAAGAAVAAVAGISYSNSQLGSASNSSSMTVASLQSELSSTQQQLNAAQGQVSSLNDQLSSSQAQLSSANATLSNANSQLTSTQAALTSANGQISTLQGQVSSASGQISTLQTQLSTEQAQSLSLQTAVDSYAAFQILGVDEVPLVNAIAETFIPTDSNGPGGADAGCAYFIDGQLAGKYGSSGHMYMQGPFIFHDLTTPVTPSETPRIFTAANGQAYTVGTNTTFSAGTMKTVPDNGMRYQYNFNLRYFWHLGLQALESYANSAYGGNFENLSSANQVKCLQDLYNNVPTQAAFNGILPGDFFYELFFMVYSGFTMDPMYGGNRGMAGWILTGNNGTNMGNFYGEGYTPKQIMLMTNPPVLKPASLGHLQKGSL